MEKREPMESSQRFSSPFYMPSSSQSTRYDQNQLQVATLPGLTAEEANLSQVQYLPYSASPMLPYASSRMLPMTASYLTYPYAMHRDFELERERAQVTALINQIKEIERQHQQDMKDERQRREKLEGTHARTISRMNVEMIRLKAELERVDSELERVKGDRDMVKKEPETAQGSSENLQHKPEEAKEKSDRQGGRNKKGKLEQNNKQLQASHEAEMEKLKNGYEKRIRELVEKVAFHNNGRLYLSSLLKKRPREHEDDRETTQPQRKKAKVKRSLISIGSKQRGPYQIEAVPVSERQDSSTLGDPIPTSPQPFTSSHSPTLVSSQPSSARNAPSVSDKGPKTKITLIL